MCFLWLSLIQKENPKNQETTTKTAFNRQKQPL
jgi:hypothetical protein